MIGDIIKVISLAKSQGNNRDQIIALTLKILRGAVSRISLIMFLLLIFLFVLGFTDIFGQAFLFAKIQFVIFFIITIIACSALLIIYFVFKKFSSPNLILINRSDKITNQNEQKEK